MSEEQLAELRKQHGELVEVTVGGKTLAFRSATAEEYDTYQAKVDRDDLGPACRELCQQTLVYPDDLGVLVATFERWPLLAAKLKQQLELTSGGNVAVERVPHPEHEEVAKVSLPEGTFVFRRPTLDEMEAHQARFKRGLGPANRAFCADVLLDPKGGRDQLDKVFQRLPVLAGGIADVLANLCGAEIEISVKKG